MDPATSLGPAEADPDASFLDDAHHYLVVGYDDVVEVISRDDAASIGSTIVTGHESGGGDFELSIASRPDHEARVRELVLDSWATLHERLTRDQTGDG